MKSNLIVIVSYRHKTQGFCTAKFQDILTSNDPDMKACQDLLARKRGQGLPFYVFGVGADRNFPLLVRLLCEKDGIPYVEYLSLFNSHVPKAAYSLFFFPRFAALLDLQRIPDANVEFHIFVNKGRLSDVEYLVERVKESGLPYTLYAEDNHVIESR